MSIDVLGDFVYTRTYARWLDDLGRREVWDESVARYFKFLHKFHGSSLSSDEWSWLQNMMRDKKIVGSMRLLWAAGPAAEEHNMTIFNCTFAAVRDLRVFSEALYILMCGSGFGYSVEEQFISQLPRIRRQKNIPKEKIVVEDSKIGWAQALHFCLETFYDGRDVEIDYSGVRPRGSRLLTMGGRASGPEPLQRLIDYARTVILSRQGTRLTPYQAHSLMCMIAEIVVVGGVRRSSLISLSDLDDQQMRDCKRGEFWNHSPHLRMANNSAVYDVQPSNVALMNEWISLINSQSGERGIFVRHNALTTAPRRKKHPAFGTNPCGEIVLRDQEMCNLSEAIARANDDPVSLSEKIRAATILGTLQSSFTDFKFLRPEWKRNADEERLLGVSITGIMDCPAIRDKDVLRELKRVAVETNAEFADRLEINHSAAITTVKPSGTVSQTLDCSSGIHTRWAKYYIRRIRISASDPLYQFASISGIPAFPEIGEDVKHPTTWVLEFPVAAPDDAITRHDLDALGQLEMWKLFKENYTEHNVSMTVYVDETEWIDVLKWLNDNWKIVGGISFLPKTHHVYTLAPYEEISREEYERRLAAFPALDYSLLSTLETDDQTTGAKEYACVSGQCEI